MSFSDPVSAHYKLILYTDTVVKRDVKSSLKLSAAQGEKKLPN